MNVIWTPEAQQDRVDIWDYIVAENPEPEVKVIREGLAFLRFALPLLSVSTKRANSPPNTVINDVHYWWMRRLIHPTGATRFRRE